MIVILGCLCVIGCVLGGFMWAGGHIGALIHPSEVLTIGGASIGALIMMSPLPTLINLFKGIIGAVKGCPYNKAAYEQTFQLLYELFRLARREGMLALEAHIGDPHESSIFKKYPKIHADHHATEFIQGAFGPLIDGSVKPEELGSLLNLEIQAMHDEHHAPVTALSKTADALPGFGIVAAVLGIVITMEHIDGPVTEIGHKVGAALVGTFLGILASYGFLGPLASKMESIGEEEGCYFRTLSSIMQGYFGGMQPKMAVETGRRGLPRDLRPSNEEMEALFKQVDSSGA